MPLETAAPVTAAAPPRSRLATLGIRSISSTLLISAVAAVVLSPLGVFTVVATLFTALGLWEYFDLLERKGLQTFRWSGILIGAGIPWITMTAADPYAASWVRESVALWLLAGALTICVIQFIRRQAHDALITVASTVFGVLYVAWLFSFVVRLKWLPGGAALVGYVLVVTKLSDMGAYLIGSACGKTPLIPRISPKKTVEGLLGGLAVSFLAALVLQSWLPVPSWGHAAALGLVLGGGAQLGDLIESLFKRDCQTKDSGGLIPGMGGILDVIDSLLFTIPVFYAYVRIVWF